MKVLITGGAGYIGSNLLRRISYLKHSVKTVDRYESISKPANCSEIIVGDLTDANLTKNICENVDCIIHLAGEANVRSSNTILQKNNLEASTLLIKSAIAQGVKKIIYISTVKNDINNEYARSKIDVENILKANNENHKLSFTILQSASVYGKGMKNGLATWLKMYKGKYFPRLPNSDSQIEMIGVNDLGEIILKCVESPITDNKTYRVNDCHLYTINEIDHACMKELGRDNNGIKAPRLLLFLFALIGGCLKYIGVSFFYNLATHNQLFHGVATIDNTLYDDLGYCPKETFYMQLKEILN